ncbi:hypothetical protein [Brevibacillus sp. NRS-1366]|uniref:hypothetical protein n=1 Tax=Brevibacillus sp. NRS-1366 TaxID=3233899 RepID=UPI003D1F9DEB
MMLMKNRPLWFKIISIIGIVIAIANLLTNAPFFKILTMLGLAGVLASYGTFELKKNHAMVFIFFGLAVFQVLVLIETLYAATTK